MRDQWLDTNRPLKAHVRKLAANACGKSKHRAIMFPAGGAHDVRAFLDAGVLTRKTDLTAIEFDPEVSRRMWVSLFKLGMGPKTTIHNGEAHTLQVSKPVDLAFLDLCGPGTFKEMDWINYLVPNITGTGSDVLITLKANHRGAGYFAEFQKRISSQDLRNEVKAIQHVPTTKTTFSGDVFVAPSSSASLKALACVRLALRRIFAEFNFTLKSTIYRDLDISTGVSQGSREMILVHLSGFSKKGANVLTWY